MRSWVKGLIRGAVLSVVYAAVSLKVTTYSRVLFLCTINNHTNEVYCSPNPLLMLAMVAVCGWFSLDTFTK